MTKMEESIEDLKRYGFKLAKNPERWVHKDKSTFIFSKTGWWEYHVCVYGRQGSYVGLTVRGKSLTSCFFKARSMADHIRERASKDS